MILQVISLSSDPTPTITGTTGGLFTANPSGLVIDSLTGVIDLDSSGAGTYTIQYITSTNLCADTSAYSITIIDVPAPTVEPLLSQHVLDQEVSLLIIINLRALITLHHSLMLTHLRAL